MATTRLLLRPRQDLVKLKALKGRVFGTWLVITAFELAVAV